MTHTHTQSRFAFGLRADVASTPPELRAARPAGKDRLVLTSRMQLQSTTLFCVASIFAVVFVLRICGIVFIFVFVFVGVSAIGSYRQSSAILTPNSEEIN